MLATLLTQLVVIIALSRLLGLLCARLRQPQVIGEMLAGILLGPTLLGWAWPTAFERLFPAASMQPLEMIAQVGVVLFLFIIGLEFDPRVFVHRGRTATTISVCSSAAPFAIGFFSTYALLHLFDPSHQANPFPTALFMGAAMSVTAFPVLARIVAERNLQKTDEGAVAIAAAAVGDVVAWTLLAGIVAITSGGGEAAAVRIAGAGVFVGFMIVVVKPFLRRMELLHERQGAITAGVFAILLLIATVSALVTELMHLHALFGAFVAGLIMPKGTRFVQDVTDRLESFVLVFLLPAFFAYAGLKVDLRNIFEWDMLGYALLIILLACGGKIGGSLLATRLMGMNWRQSLTLGVLMNTRGLMELIILTVGLSLGVINQRIYGMMVLMAITTTAMTGPILNFLLPKRELSKRVADKIFSILIPVARPESGGPLLELASYLGGVAADHRRVWALHLKRPTETELYRSFSAEALHPGQVEELEPLLEEARERNLKVDPLSFFSRDVPSDIARVARQQNIDLVLMGYHVPVFGKALLGGNVHRVMAGVDCDVAVFVDREFRTPRRILVPFLNSTHDRLALDLAGRIAQSAKAEITIVHVSRPDDAAKPERPELKTYQDPTQAQQIVIKTVADEEPTEAILREVNGQDLVVIGVSEEWGLESTLLGFRAERIASECPISMLIVRRFVSS